MNELTVLLVIVATIAVSYLYVYPKYAGNNVRLMQWLDVAMSAIPIGISAALFLTSDPSFRFIFFETNWFFFTLLTHFVLELPFFALYIKARGLWKEYTRAMGLNPADPNWGTANADSVVKQLSDSKWDGLRTTGAKRLLLVSSNLVLLGGTAMLWFLQEDLWTPLVLLHILFIGIFYFLLRKSVRLVADAPEEALDERLVQVRDRSYFVAYRFLALIGTLLASCLMGFAVFQDFNATESVFLYELRLTWTQISAVFWLVIGYGTLLPSMSLIGLDLKASSESGRK